MRDEKIKEAAEQIKMPEELKKRITDKCIGLNAESRRGEISFEQDHVSGVERVSHRPLRRILTACAACAVLAAGIGTGLYIMPKNAGNVPEISNAGSETGTNELPEAFNELLDREFTYGTETPLTEEQRNEIKNILSEYEWKEVSMEQFQSGIDKMQTNCAFHVEDEEGSWYLALYENGRASFYYLDKLAEEDEQGRLPSHDKSYFVDTEAIFSRLQELLGYDINSEINYISAPLKDIAERGYKELSYSCSEPISEEKRLEIDKLITNTEFTPEPDTEVVYGSPAYTFVAEEDTSASAALTYFYRNGIAEVHENGQIWFYSFDFEKFSEKLDDTLFADSVVTGDDIINGDTADTMVEFSSKKSFYGLELSEEAKNKLLDHIKGMKFRKTEQEYSESYSNHITNHDLNNQKLGFMRYSIYISDVNISLIMNFEDNGIVGVNDLLNARYEPSYYIYDPVEFDTVLRDAVDELSSGYPPFGTLYKMGDIKVNGEILDQKFYKSLSNAFFGFNYSGDVINNSFRDEEAVYTIEAPVNDTNLVIRVYEDGTLEYSDGEGKIHTYEGLGVTETMREIAPEDNKNLLKWLLEGAIDPENN